MGQNLLARSVIFACAAAAVLLTACLCLASEPTVATGNAAAQDEAPRGMVAIPGGKLLLGSKAEEIQKLAMRISDSDLIGYMVAEYPQHEVEVKPFHIGLTEVTNRQWKAFLDATGSVAIPYYYYLTPEPNGAPTKEAAAADEAAEEKDGAKKAASEKPVAQKAGRRAGPKKRNSEAAKRGSDEKNEVVAKTDEKDDQKKQDEKTEKLRGEWKRWENREIPTDAKGRSLADHPVTGITYGDILEFCRWSGMRLPTEEEWELAAKGPNTDRRFPWKGSWDPTLCQNVEKPPKTDEWIPESTWPVKFNPKNQSVPYGLFDMAGNVWEFTSTPFDLFPGSSSLDFKIKGKITKIPPPSDHDRRGRKVVKGGAFGNPMMGQRTTARFGMGTTEWVDAVGFRMARSPEIGRDILAAVEKVDFLGGYADELNWDRIRGAERFRWDGDLLAGHEAIAFIPCKDKEDVSNESALRRAAKVDVDKRTRQFKIRDGVLLGLLVSKLPFEEREMNGGQILPSLPAGSYLLRYVEPKADVGEPEEKDDKKKDDEEGDAKDEPKPDEPKPDEPQPDPNATPVQAVPIPQPSIILERGEPYIIFENTRGDMVAALKLEEPVGKKKKSYDTFKLESIKGLVTIESHILLGRTRSAKPAEFSIRLAVDGQKIAGDWMMTAPK